MTGFIFKLLYQTAIDKRSLEPRRVFFFLFYYLTGSLVALLVLTAALLCLEAYGVRFAHDFIYRRLGQPVLTAIEALLY